MPSRARLPALLPALLLLTLAAGCSTYRDAPLRQWGEVGKPVEPARAADSPLAPGDRVRITMRDGCDFEGRLARVGTDSLVVTRARELTRWDDGFASAMKRGPCLPDTKGRVVTVAVADIVAVQRPYPSPTKSFLLVLGLGTIALMIALVASLNIALSGMD